MRPSVSTELKGLRQRVAGWRKNGGGRGSRIPEELWIEAARVARVEGIWATAQALHFNYERLRERVEQAEGSARACGNGRSAFVELAMDRLGGSEKTVIELKSRHGDQMRIEMASGVDLVGLVRTFGRRGEP